MRAHKNEPIDYRPVHREPRQLHARAGAEDGRLQKLSSDLLTDELQLTVSFLKDYHDLVAEQKKQLLKLKDKYSDLIAKKVGDEQLSSVLGLLTKSISWIVKQLGEHSFKVFQLIEPGVSAEDKAYRELFSSFTSNITKVRTSSSRRPLSSNWSPRSSKKSRRATTRSAKPSKRPIETCQTPKGSSRRTPTKSSTKSLSCGCR